MTNNLDELLKGTPRGKRTILTCGEEDAMAVYNMTETQTCSVVVPVDTCNGCKPGEFQPSHRGAASCKSGSIASGGKRSHCSCDVCF